MAVGPTHSLGQWSRGFFDRDNGDDLTLTTLFNLEPRHVAA